LDESPQGPPGNYLSQIGSVSAAEIAKF
jgi:hypothetical protein